MVNRPYFVVLALFFAVLATCLLHTQVQARGNGNELPEKFTLLADTPFYDGPSIEGEPVGILSAFQSIQVTKADADDLDSSNPAEGEVWYLVRTWLGERWLQGGPAMVKEVYHPVHMEVTLLDTEDMYDLPLEDQRNEARLSPQTVSVTGEIFFCNQGILKDEKQESDHCRPWYRIATYLGDKWISPAQAIEHYEDNQAVAAFTPFYAAYQAKFFSSTPELEPFNAKHSVEMVSLHSENGIARLEVRRPYHHREKLNDEDVESLKNAILTAVGGRFPLSITTFTLNDKADLTGKILSIDKERSRVLVIDYDNRIGREQPIPNAFWIGLAVDVNIHRNGQETKLSLDDLRIGQTVEVWKARFTAMSYPGQTTGYEISIVEEVGPDEESIPLSLILGLDFTRINKIELKFTKDKTLVIQEANTIQEISERMQHIVLQGADQYPNQDRYTLTLYQDDKKAVYSGNLVLGQLPYKPTPSTTDLDEFIQKLQ